MPSDTAQLLVVIQLAIDMRRAQRRYFRALHGSAEKRQALEQSMVAERAFDAAAAKVTAPGLDFGGSHALRG